MTIPTRVVRCERCHSKIIMAHAEVTSRGYDGDPLTFVCADSILCTESQEAGPTAVVLAVPVEPKDIPF